MKLYEKYRPGTWADVIGQGRAVSVLQSLAGRGAGGQAVWITGASGTGKTTMARLLALEVADQFNIVELDATDLTPARLREIEDGMTCYGMGKKPGRAYIVNEAHGMRQDTIRKLLVILERLPGHVVFIFTTTNAGQDMLFDGAEDPGPMLSRCIRVSLTTQGLCKAFADHVKTIALVEGLDGRPIEQYERLAKDCKNNMRAMLQAVESGAMLV